MRCFLLLAAQSLHANSSLLVALDKMLGQIALLCKGVAAARYWTHERAFTSVSSEVVVKVMRFEKYLVAVFVLALHDLLFALGHWVDVGIQCKLVCMRFEWSLLGWRGQASAWLNHDKFYIGWNELLDILTFQIRTFRLKVDCHSLWSFLISLLIWLSAFSLKVFWDYRSWIPSNWLKERLFKLRTGNLCFKKLWSLECVLFLLEDLLKNKLEHFGWVLKTSHLLLLVFRLLLEYSWAQ
jgi:hypothetical protein